MPEPFLNKGAGLRPAMFKKKSYVWNPATCSCENKKYLASIMGNSAIMCDIAIDSYDEETKAIPTNFNEKKATCKTQNLYMSLAILLITISLLIAVSIDCYLIKYRARQKHLLSFNFPNNEVKEIIY